MNAIDQQTLLRALESDDHSDRIIGALGALGWVLAEIQDQTQRSLLLRNCIADLPEVMEYAVRCQRQITDERETRH